MELDYHKGAEKDLDELNDEVESEVRDKVSELREKLTSHSDVKLINIEGRPVFRLKVGERNQKLDHRVIFDIKNSDILVLAVIHRDEGYNTISI
ncbi:type II toxin-antitoxin system RelE family toxin [Candidatus Nanohalobium constans]|uniref:Type II toxin-antitoxin system RelE/ParE family toxin n=1 Tax=Candidatus Nanohalobium constans TaxID=2565781 RepID=A0A5Q0UER9_9ARCH|nr:type II toxin-antitoxin system RelE/ParE family toxin [Candidatus Nanohalobium constans]QGA80036.1 hypothetical protein LC1Nh_0128 [Candidatus Nanohalobium constans]